VLTRSSVVTSIGEFESSHRVAISASLLIVVSKRVPNPFPLVDLLVQHTFNLRQRAIGQSHVFAKLSWIDSSKAAKSRRALHILRVTRGITTSVLLMEGIDHPRCLLYRRWILIRMQLEYQSQLANLKAENARREAKIKNMELQAKLAPLIDPNREALANFDADRRLADAERAAIEAELALRAARAQLDGG